MKSSRSIFFILPLLVLLPVHPLIAQESSLLLQGFVVDDVSGDPLYNANVYLLSMQKGAVTDREGYFQLMLTTVNRTDTLVINYLGYKEYRSQVKNHINKSIIRLLPEILKSEKVITVFAEKLDLSRQDLPHTVFSVDPEQIQRYATTEISDLFKTDPAIRMEGNDLDGRRIQVRGSDANEVNVYIDGILLNSAGFNNAADLSVIPASHIEKLEILKGSNLILLGSGAFGGVINITTRKKLETEYTLHLKYGSALSKYGSAEINLPLTNRLLLNYFGNMGAFSPQIEYYTSEKFEEKTEAHSITSLKQNHHLTLNYFLDRGQYTGKFMGYFLDYRKPSWKNLSKNLITAVSYQGDLFRSKNFEFSAQYIFDDDQTDRLPADRSRYISNFLAQRLHIRSTKNFSTESMVRSTQFNLQLISEYFHDELVSERTLSAGDNQSRLYKASVYDNRASLGGVLSFQDQLDMAGLSNWKITSGMRGDFLAAGKSYRVSTFGFQVEIIKNAWTFSPYLSYGENIKFPSLLDNAYRNEILNLSLQELSLDPVSLKPEYNVSAEAGMTLQYHPGSDIFETIDLTAAVYSNRVTNKILKRPLENSIIQTQQGVNTTRGIESALKVSKIFTYWNLILAYGQISIDNPLLYAFKPDKNLNFQLEYVSSFGFYCTGTFFYEGKSIAWDYDPSNQFVTERVAPFYDVDLILGYEFSLKNLHLQIRAAGYNILDQAGYKFYYLNKRFLQIGLSLRY